MPLHTLPSKLTTTSTIQKLHKLHTWSFITFATTLHQLRRASTPMIDSSPKYAPETTTMRINAPLNKSRLPREKYNNMPSTTEAVQYDSRELKDTKQVLTLCMSLREYLSIE
jgi:hypothetical protein